MVEGALDLNATTDHASEGAGQFGAIGVENGDVVKAGASRRRVRPTEALPGVEAEVVVVATGRQERRLLVVHLHQLKTEGVAVERDRALQIRDPEVDVADLRL